MLNKPSSDKHYLNDWEEPRTNDWIKYAQTVQLSHCRSINAHEKGVRYPKDLFHKIDELVLVHAFGGVSVPLYVSGQI